MTVGVTSPPGLQWKEDQNSASAHHFNKPRAVMVSKLPSVYMKPMSMDERRVFSYLTSSLLSSYTAWSFWCECASFLARYHLRRAGVN